MPTSYFLLDEMNYWNGVFTGNEAPEHSIEVTPDNQFIYGYSYEEARKHFWNGYTWVYGGDR